MAKKIEHVPRNAERLKDSITAAEAQRTTDKRPDDGMVSINPFKIQMRPHLFQPRGFFYREGPHDPDFVKTLVKRIKVEGELDPPTVIKIGRDWVCVDGHHRIAAYKRPDAKWRDSRFNPRTIRCHWFPGTVREAVDESLRGNNKDKLPLAERDRMNRAWVFTLLGDRSKAETAKLCGVGESTVALMRRVKRAYYDDSDQAARLVRDRFQKRLGIPLEETTSWLFTRLAYAGVELKERSEREEAEKLARTIERRLSDRLKRDPKVTAAALLIHSPDLVTSLKDEWSKPDTTPALDDDDDVEAAIEPRAQQRTEQPGAAEGAAPAVGPTEPL